MVSTRGFKSKFFEGERVLCYEPDPTKAKVLYDSKVLEVIYSKDVKNKSGQSEYLIHFQGWNSSWDRQVQEEYVLKDTEENRELQKQLAEKSNIKLSIKSNRIICTSLSEKKRKRRLSETIRETFEQEKKTESDSSVQDTEASTDEDDSASSSELEDDVTSGDQSLSVDDSKDDVQQSIQIHINDELKSVLDYDDFFINEKNKLLNLPSKKCVLSILDDYVRYFSIRYSSRNRKDLSAKSDGKEKSFMTLELCKDVMDGIRTCFDFYVYTILLYPKERDQVERLKKCSSTSCFLKSPSNSEVNDTKNKNGLHRSKNYGEKKGETPTGRSLRSRRLQLDCESTAENNSNEVNSCESGRTTPTNVSVTSEASSFASSNKASSFARHDCALDENFTLLPHAFRYNNTPVLIYGAVHLLRLFVKLPEILYRMKITGDRKKIISFHIDLFLEYLVCHADDLFQDSDYVSDAVK